MGFTTWGSRFGVHDLGFTIWGPRFGVHDLGFTIWGSRFGVHDLGFTTWGPRFGVHDDLQVRPAEHFGIRLHFGMAGVVETRALAEVS